MSRRSIFCSFDQVWSTGRNDGYTYWQCKLFRFGWLIVVVSIQKNVYDLRVTIRDTRNHHFSCSNQGALNILLRLFVWNDFTFSIIQWPRFNFSNLYYYLLNCYIPFWRRFRTFDTDLRLVPWWIYTFPVCERAQTSWPDYSMVGTVLGKVSGFQELWALVEVPEDAIARGFVKQKSHIATIEKLMCKMSDFAHCEQENWYLVETVVVFIPEHDRMSSWFR